MTTRRRRLSRELLLLILCGGVLLVLWHSERRRITAAQPQSVILIVTDTLRADRVGANRNGVPLMPALTALARHSRYFPRAISQGSWTKPAMASIFTSLCFDTHRLQYIVPPQDPADPGVAVLLPEHQTITSLLHDHGYQTVGIQSNPILQTDSGFARAFDRYQTIPEQDARQVTDAALQALPQLKPPYFLYVHYFDPHSPYNPPQAYREKFGPLPALGASDQQIFKDFDPYQIDQLLFIFVGAKSRKYPSLTAMGREVARTLYDGEIRYLDDQLGRLLEAVHRQAPEALLVFTADHGEELWEHGALGHGSTVHREQVEVPLIIHGPDIDPGQVDRPVQSFGILPTIAAELELPVNPRWQGRDLLAAGAEVQVAFSHTRAVYPNMPGQSDMVQAGHFKLQRLTFPPKIELFDLNNDPWEQHDIAAERPVVVAQLTRLLEQHRLQNGGQPRKGAVAPSGDFSAETLRHLHQLGYM